MKKRAYAIEAALIFFILILPPLIFNRAPVDSFTPVYHWSQFLLFALAFFLSRHLAKDEDLSGAFKPAPFLYPAVFLISFGCLCLISALVQGAFHFLGSGSEVEVLAPSGFLAWANCLAGTAGAAFYEEVLFRQFLPDRLERLFAGKKRWIRFVWEGALVLLFAVSHWYAGLPALVNAFFAAIVLRLAFIRSRSIALVSASHALYNLLSILVMLF